MYYWNRMRIVVDVHEMKTNTIDNDVNFWLRKKNLLNLRENFLHNGFDMSEFVFLQLFSEFTVDLLTNYMHIYDPQTRKALLYALNEERRVICKY